MCPTQVNTVYLLKVKPQVHEDYRDDETDWRLSENQSAFSQHYEKGVTFGTISIAVMYASMLIAIAS